MTTYAKKQETNEVQLFEIQTEFFLPIWRRVAVAASCLAWSTLEFFTSGPFWGLIFLALGVYAIWQFFFDGWPE